jgi:hypothetical protein
VALEKCLRAGNEPLRSRVQRPSVSVRAKGAAKELDDRLFPVQRIRHSALEAAEESCAEALERRLGPMTAAAEQRMRREMRRRSPGHVRERLVARRDDQLRITARHGLRQPERLPARHEQHLVGIADDVVAADVPDEKPAVGEADLDCAREAVPPARAFPLEAADVLGERHRCVEQRFADRVRPVFGNERCRLPHARCLPAV